MPVVGPLVFAALLREHRLAAGLTQAAVAERAGLAERTIQDLERGIGLPRRDTLGRLASALSLSPDDRARFERAAAPRRRPRRGPDPTRLGETKGPTGRLPSALGQALAPGPLTTFVGRDRELSDLADLLAGSRLVTVTGAGGCGKTRLAQELVARVRPMFEDGVAFVPLAPVGHPRLVAHAIAECLGIMEAPDQAIPLGLVRAIGTRHLLLVLDNFEHVVEGAGLLVELLSSCPHLVILVTSREVLRLRGEQAYPTPSLSVPDLAAVLTSDDAALACADPESGAEAVRLFADRARRAHPGFRLNAETARAIAEICIRLDGLPLAIELAATRVKLLPPRAMLARVGRRLPLLTGGPRDLPARQQTLRAAIAWSYDLLDEDERRLFRRLSVFVGGWPLDAAERVGRLLHQEGGHPAASTSAGGHPEPGILDLLASLVDKSLVQSDVSVDGEPRFTMLETMREFALECLEASGEDELVRREHALAYLAFIERARPRLRGRDAVSWLRCIEAEHDNLRAAMDWGAAHANESVSGFGGVEPVGGADILSGIDLASRIALASSWFWALRNHLRQAREWTDRLLVRATPGTAAHARLLTVDLAVSMYTDDIAAVRRAAEASHAAWHALGDRYQSAIALARLAHAEASMGDPRLTAPLLAHLESVSGDRRHAADLEQPPILYRATVARRTGAIAVAVDLCEQALAMGREDGDLHTIQTALRFLGIIAAQQGDHDRARRLFSETVAVDSELGDHYCMMGTLAWIAVEAIEHGNPSGAARLYGFLARVWDERGHRVLGLIGVEEGIGRARVLLGEAAFAAAWAEGRAMTLEQAVAYALDEQPPPPRVRV